MSKESFKQFVKRQEEKLDKAEKMVEGVKEGWKDKIEELIEKSVKELKKLWEENEKEMRRQRREYETFFFSYSLPLPETSPSFLERVFNKFLKEFDWKKFEGRRFLNTDLGLFLSAFLKKNVENYVLSQERKGVKEENIKPIEVHLNVKELPVLLNCLGYQNPKKLHLIIEGDCGSWTGDKMQGGKIIIEGSCEYRTGVYMQGGELNIKGEVNFFDITAFSPPNKGTIIWKNTKIWENGDWTKEGKEMWEKGEIPVR